MTRAERRAAEAAGARRDREAARQRAGGTGVWEQGARAARRPGPASLGRRPQLGRLVCFSVFAIFRFRVY